TVLNYLLERHEQTVLAALLGLMVGSLRVLWPWPNGVGYTIEEGETEVTIPGTELDLWPDLRALGGALLMMTAAAGLTILVVALADRFTVEDSKEAVSV
ncbi:MAG: undecaprenyl phosphate translocase family protein, partial [Acidimicrobiales bacterium]